MALTKQQREQLAESVAGTCNYSVNPEYWINLWGEETRADVQEFDDDLEANCAEFEVYLCPVCNWWSCMGDDLPGLCYDCREEEDDEDE